MYNVVRANLASSDVGEVLRCFRAAIDLIFSFVCVLLFDGLYTGVLNVLERVFGVVRYSGRRIKELCEVVAGFRVHVQKRVCCTHQTTCVKGQKVSLYLSVLITATTWRSFSFSSVSL